ncbi:MAG: Crp/Fnr family transcriptional regulator [Burkholderiales bacterium]
MPSLLAKVSYFADLDAGALERIERRSRSRTYAAGQIVFLEGEPCLDLCILESGRVLFYRTSAEGREQVLKVFEQPGDTFCIPSAFSAGRHIVNVKAASNTRLRMLDMQMVNAVVREHPSVGLKLIATAGEHMKHLVTLAQDLALKTTTARLAKHLHDLASSERASESKRLSIPRAHLRQDELASMLGTVRVNVSRSLANLVRSGAIQLDRKSIHIRDLPTLKRISQGK